MRLYFIYFLFLSILYSCVKNNTELSPGYPDIKIVGAMKNVMWKGELEGMINLDTIASKEGLYGLGPLSFLQGELLINNGKSFISKVDSDSSILIRENFDVTAPFFVYGNVLEWAEQELPDSITEINSLEKFIDQVTKNSKRPFVFKLLGEADHIDFHIQNLPEGTKVSSPQEAHQGQVNYTIEQEEVEIIGFFSTEHQGIFTHHDSFLHMHMITSDLKQMGHIDSLSISNHSLKLYFPVR